MSRKYDREFKVEAVRMAQEEGATATEVWARGMISRWKRQLLRKGEDAFPGKGHLSALEEERRLLKHELGRVTREREILRKALAIFSKEQQQYPRLCAGP